MFRLTKERSWSKTVKSASEQHMYPLSSGLTSFWHFLFLIYLKINKKKNNLRKIYKIYRKLHDNWGGEHWEEHVCLTIFDYHVTLTMNINLLKKIIEQKTMKDLNI